MASELWQRLRAVRKHTQMSGEAFGAEFGISKGAVSQWEAPDPAKRTRPELQNIIDMAKKFEIPLDWLLDDRSDVDHEWWVDVDEAQSVDHRPAGSDQQVPRQPDLAHALPVVLGELAKLTPGKWDMVRARLGALPGRPEAVAEVLGDVAPVLGLPANSVAALLAVPATVESAELRPAPAKL